MRLPDFLIIGAAKSGTTTLYKYCSRHPQIFMSTPKEPNFFTKDEGATKGIDWYASLFSEAEPQQVCGEATPFYSMASNLPKCAERIKNLIPHTKLIYIMRNPVDRAYAQWAHSIRIRQYLEVLNQVPETFEEGLEKNKNYLDSSYYMNIIESYLKFFPKKLLLFLLMEDLIKQPASTMCDFFHFLGVDESIDVTQNGQIAANQANVHAKGIVRSKMTAPLKKIPGLHRAVSLLPRGVVDLGYQAMMRLPYRKQLEQDFLPQPMRPETRQMLLEKFYEPNQRLSEFLNRDLSHWSK